MLERLKFNLNIIGIIEQLLFSQKLGYDMHTHTPATYIYLYTGCPERPPRKPKIEGNNIVHGTKSKTI